MMPQPLPADPHLHVPPHPVGLGGLMALVEGRAAPMPLRALKVRAEITGDCARTVVEQTFDNPHDHPVEVVHILPLPDEGAVVELALMAGDVFVQAECRERGEAARVFDEARAAGHRAALLDAERDDVHTLRATRVPPGEAVTVRLVVVERLLRADGWIRWRFPTVIAPRYLPGTPTRHEGPSTLPATTAVPDADRLQPPTLLAGGARLDLEVTVAGPVRALRCAQHAVSLTLDDGGVRVAPAAEARADRDFVLAFHGGEPEALSARAWTDGEHVLVLVEPPARALAPALPREAVFVIDISGSMQGPKLDAARRALVAALHGLMPGDRFRLIAFDDQLERHPARGALPVSDASLAEADAWVARLAARGGTEMLPAVKAALDFSADAPAARSVLFITDGQAWNEDELVAAVANRRGAARFFTLGIDSAVNSALLRRMARVGGGTCTCLSPREDVEQAMAEIEARFGSPVIEGLRVEGRSAAALQDEALFAGRACSLLVEGGAEPLVVVGQGAEGPFHRALTPLRARFPFGALWARARIAALQDRLTLKPFEEEALRGEILRLALRHGLASRYTSFVAVDRSRRVLGPMEELVQAHALPSGWGASAAPPPPPSPPPAPGRSRASRRQAAAPPEPEVFAIAEPSGWSGTPSRLHDSEDDEDRYVARRPQAPAPRREAAPPPAAAPAAAPEEAPAAKLGASSDPAGVLARSQRADGSFGDDLARTAAALLALLRLGHTRRSGARRRTVLKAAAWLARHAEEPLVAMVLDLLAKAEAGEALTPSTAWEPLYAAGPEGALLREAA